MESVAVTQAQSVLEKLVDEVNKSSEPIQITGKRGNAVLISEDDWRAIRETLYLLSIPGMHESVKEGLETPPDECSEKPGW